jgi:DNA-directed RNA polymerase subunit RPC12/RpoP
MAKMRQYKCYRCGEEYEVLFRGEQRVSKTIKCNCGARAKRLFGAQIVIDDWSPMTMDAQKDIEHFEKKRIKNGKYVSSNIYREDRMKQDIPMNHGEV